MNSIGDKLNQRVEFFLVNEVPSLDGGTQINNVPIAKVWASVSQASSYEIFSFEKLDSASYFTIKTRFLPNIMVGYKVIFNSQEMLIKSALHNIVTKDFSSFVGEYISIKN